MGFEQLKARHSVVWGAAPYERVSDYHLHVHEELLYELQLAAGERLLDVATGTGEVARRAAARGAEVTGLDLAPALIERAEKRAADEGLVIRFEVGDAENLSYEDASYDVVTSAFGSMFAPDHRAVARELARVVRPGGRLGLATWLPEGGVRDMFRVMAPFQPPAPEGVGFPFDWGRTEYVTELLGEAFDLRFNWGVSVQAGESGRAMWELMSTNYGPTKVLADSLDPERREQLAAAFAALYDRNRLNGEARLPRPYLLTIGTRKGA